MNGVQVWNPARLTAARRAAGLSQEALANRITGILKREAQPVRTRNVVRWERPRGASGAHAPHADFIAAIAEATAKEPSYFLGSDDTEEERLLRLRRMRSELVLAGRDDLADELQQIAAQFAPTGVPA